MTPRPPPTVLSRVFNTNTPEETIELGERLARGLIAGDAVLLEGELGAGKTQFVRGLAIGLGVADGGREVSSPTFVLMNEYAAPGGGTALVHIDAYRLSGGDDLDAVGFDHARRCACVVAVEWASRLGVGTLGVPADRIVEVRLAHAGAGERRIELRVPSVMASRPALRAIVA